jgi:hypothetical protein
MTVTRQTNILPYTGLVTTFRYVLLLANVYILGKKRNWNTIETRFNVERVHVDHIKSFMKEYSALEKGINCYTTLVISLLLLLNFRTFERGQYLDITSKGISVFKTLKKCSL